MQEEGTRDPQLEWSTKKQGDQDDDGRTKEEATKGPAQEPIPEGSGTEQTYTQAMDEQEAPEQHNDGENEEIMTVEAQMLDLTVDENRDTGKNGEQCLVVTTSRRQKQGRKERESRKSERKETESEQATPGTYWDDFPPLQASEEEESQSFQNIQIRKNKRTDRTGMQSRSRSRSAVRGRVSDTSQ